MLDVLGAVEQQWLLLGWECTRCLAELQQAENRGGDFGQHFVGETIQHQRRAGLVLEQQWRDGIKLY